MDYQEIGALIEKAIHERGETRRKFYMRTGLNVRTLRDAIEGSKPPTKRTQTVIEEGLGWEYGTIERLLREGGNATPQRGLSTHSSEELAAELMYRLRSKQEEIDQLKAERQSWYGLAAHKGEPGVNPGDDLT